MNIYLKTPADLNLIPFVFHSTALLTRKLTLQQAKDQGLLTIVYEPAGFVEGHEIKLTLKSNLDLFFSHQN